MGAIGAQSVGNTTAILIGATSLATFTTAPAMLAAARYTKWVFQLEGTFTNYSVQVFGTTDILTSGWIGYGPTSGLAQNWFLLPAESVQAGTGTEQNPLTAVNQSLTFDRPLKGVMAIFTGTAQTGTCGLYGYATP